MSDKLLPASHSPDLPNWYLTHKSFPENYPDVSVGKHSCGVPQVSGSSLHGIKLTIGDYCSFGKKVRIEAKFQHKTDALTTYAFFQHPTLYPKAAGINTLDYRGTVVIGNSCWIGDEVIILGGAYIGDGAVIGSFSVVAGKVPPYAIVAGNPAKVIRYCFPPEVIEKLLEIKWWNWPEDFIREHADILCIGDINDLIKLSHML